MSKSKKNLGDAFAGESQANRKYLAFAVKAEKEGYPAVARLFRAAADAETVHAMNHLKAMGAVGTTAENLKAAVEGETYEFEEMYPGMIDDAKAESDKAAERTLNLANEVEKVHAGLFRRALEELGKDGEAEYHVCQVCGHTVEGEPPDKCPVCGSARKMFKKID